MKILRGTVFGGITYFILGWLIYGIILNAFMQNNLNQCAARPDDAMIWWPMIVASLVLALFLTLVLKWTGANGIMDGIKTGALFGLLFGISVDLSNYSMSTTFNNLSAVFVDVVVWVIMQALVGIVIVLTWGKAD